MNFHQPLYSPIGLFTARNCMRRLSEHLNANERGGNMNSINTKREVYVADIIERASAKCKSHAAIAIMDKREMAKQVPPIGEPAKVKAEEI